VAVSGGPIADGVGHDAPVVLRRHLEVDPARAGCIQPVHPGVAGQYDFEELTEREGSGNIVHATGQVA